MTTIKKVFIIFMLLVPLSASANEIVSEESLETAFIFNFLKFVQWGDALSTYNICIPENDALRRVATDSLKDKILNDRKILVTDQTTSCHILVSDNPPNSESTLTIGHLDQGAMFEFMVIDNKLKFAINIDNIRKSKLKISSELLNLAVTKD